MQRCNTPVAILVVFIKMFLCLQRAVRHIGVMQQAALLECIIYKHLHATGQHFACSPNRGVQFGIQHAPLGVYAVPIFLCYWILARSINLVLLQKFCISLLHKKIPQPLFPTKSATLLALTLIKNFPPFNLICFN